MTKNEKKLAAVLLGLASDEFRNHGCNDFSIANHVQGMTSDEMTALDLAAHAQNGDPEEHDPDADHNFQTDFVLMDYLAAKLMED